MRSSILCLGCRSPLPLDVAQGGKRKVVCTRCRLPAEILLFSAFYREDENRHAVLQALTGDATCFNHPERQALSVCDNCGRLLCGVCSIAFNERTLCAACLHREQAQAERDGKGFNARRSRFDQMALTAIVVSVFVWPLSFVTASYALYLSVRHWRTPLSLLPYSRWRFVVASLMAIGILAGWAVAIFFIVRGGAWHHG